MPETRSARIGSFLAEMTLKEKIAQLGGLLALAFIGDTPVLDLAPNGVGQISQASFLGPDPVRLATRLNETQEELAGSRLGIPALFHTEATGGVTHVCATAFPTAINQAATWDPAATATVARVTPEQMKALGLHLALTPVLDVARDPRWGRVHETFGEDPYLCAAIGAAFVRGLQGNGEMIDAAACGKHFLAYGASEGGRNHAPVQMGDREVRDVYARPFEAAIRLAGMAAVMPSYSAIDGEAVSGSRRYLTDLLRDELGFDGVTVSDYQAVSHLHTRQFVAPDAVAAAIQAVTAGMDVEKPQLDEFSHLVEAVEDGRLDLAVIDRAVARSLRAKERLGLFDDPYVDTGEVMAHFDLPEHEAESRRVAGRSLVLLQNDGVLPLRADSGTVAVIGPFADSMRCQFGGYTPASASELAHALQDVTDPDKLMEAVADVMFGTGERAAEADVDSQVRADYPTGSTVLDALRSRLGSEHVTYTKGADLRLPGGQVALVDAVIDAGPPVVVVPMHGRPLVLGRLTGAAAILDAGYPGHHGGAAIADVLIGSENPGGKLPVSYPGSVGHTPRYSTARVGLHRSGYVDSDPEDAFALGHGLSYTSFELADLLVAPAQVDVAGSFQVSCSVANTGEQAGDEVVQLYFRDRVASISQPQLRLEGFARVTLDPGETRTVRFELRADQLCFAGTDGSLIIEPGEFDVRVGTSSRDIRLEGELEIAGTISRVGPKRGLLSDVTVSAD